MTNSLKQRPQISTEHSDEGLLPLSQEPKQSIEMSAFARSVYEQKYAWKDEEGNVVEDWDTTAWRVASNVLHALGYSKESPEVQTVYELIRDRKFIPGGRYLYASGRELHQVQNCLLLKAEDSREGWAELLYKSAMALQTGAGIGVDYSGIRPSGSVIRRTGGTASGPIALMKMVNEVGRGVMQGGARRSAIWAGLNWKHGDILDFIKLKNWSKEDRERKEQNPNHKMEMEFTNISILLDDEFFEAYEDECHHLHALAHQVYKTGVKQMIKTAEPGFSVDIGEDVGETLRNAPVAGETQVLTSEGYERVDRLFGIETTVWTGSRWVDGVVFDRTQENAPILKVKMTGGREIRCEPSHEFLVERYVGRGQQRKLDGISRVPAKDLVEGDVLHVSLPTGHETKIDASAYELGFLYGDGTFTKAGGAEVTFCTEESKKALPLMVGASSITERDGRGYTRAYYGVSPRFSDRSKDRFPIWRSQRSLASFLAGLFDADGNYESNQHRIRLASKHQNFLRDAARALERLGILAGVSKAGISTYGQAQGWQLVVMADSHDEFARLIPTQRLSIDPVGLGYRRSTIKVLSVGPDGTDDVYCADVGVPEHSFMAEGVIISNCTEVTSRDDSDICNLGSINLARIESKEEMGKVVRYGTLFLLAGTVYSDLPYDRVDVIRTKNRRLGLGVMGVHEWLLQRDYPYGPNDELAEWLDLYAESGTIAHNFALNHGLSSPVKTRAIAPTGTIGIVAETTTGIEPIFCVAYKRRVKTAQANGEDITRYQYVIDPTAKRLVEQGIDPADIEDAYVLSYNVERRVEMQAWMQKWVDHGISSTINLPYPITDQDERDDFAAMLIEWLPQLRGITVYPDGARGNQPLTAVPYDYAVTREGVVFEEDEGRCVSGACGV